MFLTDEDKLVGTWNSEGIWLDVPTVIVFSSNGTFKMRGIFDIGILNNSAIDFSLGKGKWDMNDGILTMEIVDVFPPNNYTYQFSEDSRTLTLTPIDGSNSYILRKQ